MIELIQVPWSPYCIVQRRILEYSGAKFKIINIPNGDRSLVWKLSRQRFYQVPLLRDGKSVIFEPSDNWQVISKYLDSKLVLGLFPAEWERMQSLIWRYFENDVEGIGFKLNDIYWEEMVPASDRLLVLRHKERKFGRGCITQWRKQQAELVAQFDDLLLPCEEMLFNKPFLLGHKPHFLDFNLFGIIGNFLYSGHYKIPARHTSLIEWYDRMRKLKFSA